VTEDLTTNLSRISGSLVISRNTAFTYKDKPVSTKQIGRELGVRYVLEGSVRRSSNQVQVSVQLIDAGTDGHLWAEQFDSDTGDLFILQNEITGRIAVTLSLELVAAEAARPTERPEAFDYVLRGRAASLKPKTRDSYTERIAMFERALALDPQSVEAQSYLAINLTARALDGMSASAAAHIKRAERLAGQASAVSPRDPLAHYAKGQVLRAQNRCHEAITEYETVVALNRNWVTAYAHIGRCKVSIGSIEEAIPLYERALRLSPRDPEIGNLYLRIGNLHLLQSHTDEAIIWLEKARGATLGLPQPHAHLTSAYALKGETVRAAAELAETRRLGGEGSYLSIASQRAEFPAVPKIHALREATYFAGLRKAGVPEE
jgi:tetratricopeptide (TPR) repeat protein